jgi:hypothetical protein
VIPEMKRQPKWDAKNAFSLSHRMGDSPEIELDQVCDTNKGRLNKNIFQFHQNTQEDDIMTR